MRTTRINTMVDRATKELEDVGNLAFSKGPIATLSDEDIEAIQACLRAAENYIETIREVLRLG